MSYEEIKNSIEQDLIRQGFERKGDDLVKVNVRRHQMVVNGVSSVQEEKQEIKFSCIGEGSIDDQPTAGFSLFINDHNVTDFWCTCLEDFQCYETPLKH